MSFVLSEHLLKQALERDIDIQLIEDVLNNPDQIVNDESGEAGQKVYQSIVELSKKKAYYSKSMCRYGEATKRCKDRLPDIENTPLL